MYNRTPPREGGSTFSFTPPKVQPADFEPQIRLTNGSSSSRFTPNTFQYNERVATALLPCLLVLLGAGGTPVVGTLLVGLMISYVLDALQFKRGAFLAIWGSFLATALSMAVCGVGFGHHIPASLSLITLFTCCHLVFLCGVWTSLQFKWLQLEHPTVVVALERLLFACCPFISTAVLTWGVVAAVGISHAPFYMMPILFTTYWLFSLPCPSSFSASSGPASFILTSLESRMHSAVLLFLPASFHFAIHHAMVLHTVNDLCDHLFLFFVPLLFLLFASSRGALSWLSKDPSKLQKIQLLNGSVAIVVLLACLEIRVIFTSFSHYIHLPWPLNILLVSMAVYGLGLGGAAHVMGLLKDTAMGRTAVTSILVGSAGAASLVLGMPFQLLPFPALAAAFLAHFYTSSSPWSYMAFLVGTAVTATWFLTHNFWFLEASLGNLPVSEVCQLLVGSLVLALAVPGASAVAGGGMLLGVSLIAHAAMLCRIEDVFYNHGHEEEGLYPSYIVVLTSAAGFLCCRRLLAERRIAAWAAWIASCFYLAKLSLLLVADSDNTVWAAAGLAMAVSPPVLLYNRSVDTSSTATKKLTSRPSQRMKPWQAVGHVAAMAVALWLCRTTLFDALLWWTGHAPGVALLVGVLLLALAAACVPLLALHFPNHQSARRSLVLLSSFALLLLFLQPPLPLLASEHLWDPQHVPAVEDWVDDAAIYGGAGASAGATAGVASWLLLGGLIASLAAATSALPVSQVPAVRLLYSAGMGVVVGLYVSLHFFSSPSSPLPLVFHLLLLSSCVCTAVFLLFTVQPSASSPRLLPLLFAALVALLPSTWLMVGWKGGADKEEDEDLPGKAYYGELAVEELQNSVVAMFCAAFLLISLVIKLTLTRLLALRGEGGKPWVQLPNTSPFAPKHRSIQHRSNSFMKSLSVKKLAAEGSWLPIVGNISTLLCFSLALYLNTSVSHNSEKSIVVIAPILLLLSHDATIFTSFTDRQRYFPLTLATSSYLALISAWRLFEEAYFSLQVGGVQLQDNEGLISALKDYGFLLLSVPNHVAFNKYLWDFARQSDYLLLVISPLNIPGIFLSDSPAAKAVAVLGLLYAVAQYLISRHVRIAGMKFV